LNSTEYLLGTTVNQVEVLSQEYPSVRAIEFDVAEILAASNHSEVVLYS
jgi:hypothetical protein